MINLKLFENPGFQVDEENDEKAWVEEVRKQRRLPHQEENVKQQKRLQGDQQMVLRSWFSEIRAGEELRSLKDSDTKQKLMNKTLEDDLKLEAKSGTLSVSDTMVGSKQLTFTLKSSEQRKKQQEAEKLHRQEENASSFSWSPEVKTQKRPAVSLNLEMILHVTRKERFSLKLIILGVH
ncbi:hypothetical protein HPG69_016320 [Diceros bicornis minor]|uniref:Uncharacterized protein n=1 Tax=Diceros bicornis minor TaxID=77932 RepID=A0A7J7F6Z6_DICBM|nr:hypothetical protein HPG69_016320 [Diceros bicornis minor]